MYRLFGHGIAVIAVAVLGGCATQAQQQAQLMAAEATDAEIKLGACIETARTTNEFLYLNEQFILGENDPMAARKMAIRALPSQMDKENILAYLTIISPCREIAITEWGQVHPAYAATIAEYIATLDENLSLLLTGEITIGERNVFVSRQIVAYNQKALNVGDDIYQNLDASHQYEMDQRARAVTAFQNWNYQQQQLLLQQQALYMDNRPLTTNCYYIGNFLSCTTQ